MTVESKISLNCTDVMAPVTLSYLSAVIGAIYCPVTVVGNGLIILAIILDPFRELRTQFNFFVVNLAAADLIVGTLIDPLTSWAHFKEAIRVEVREEYPYFVKFVHFNYFASITASLLSLSALSIDRLIAVRFPLKYRSNVSFTEYGLAALVIWVLAYGLSGMYFAVGYVTMAWVMASFSCVFTFIVMMCCYFLLYLVIKHREEALLESLNADIPRKTSPSNHTQADNPTQPTSSNAVSMEQNNPKNDSVSSNVTSSRHAAQTRKTVTVLLVLFFFFLLCFVPATIMIFIINLERGDCIFRHWLRDLQFLFCVTSSLINPFIYTLRLPNFRRAIFSILRLKKNNTTHVVPVPMQTRSGGGT